VQQVAVLGVDDALLSAARGGDQAAFERLVMPHIAAGHRLAAAILNDSGNAEDCVQEALHRAWRSIRQLRSGAQTRGWFLTIVSNRARSMRRARWWSVVGLPDALARASNPADAVAEHEDLKHALARLSAEERAAVFLYFYEDMKSQEIGGVLGITASAARSRIHRALRRLRVDMAEEVK